MTPEERPLAFERYVPKTDIDWRSITEAWVFTFRRKYLSNFQAEMSDVAKQLFLVDWRDTAKRQNCDFEGDLMVSILNAKKLLNCSCCPVPSQGLRTLDKRGEEFDGLSNVQATCENSTIMLEILKYYGRDVNIVEAWNQFRAIHKRYVEECLQLPPEQPKLNIVDDDSLFRSWFLRALSDLKV